MPKLTRAITSFVAVLGAFWLYTLVVVPMIEPAAPKPQSRSSGSGRQGAADRINSRLANLQQLVPAEARALLETPWIAQHDDFKLLYQSYKNLPDGRVRIEPCLLIYTAGSSQESVETKPPVVLFAPKGATMVFDGPIDLRRGELGRRPVSGRLHGEITITSPGESSGPEDDLRIVTRDVQLTRERISTPDSVSFCYGASVGRGSHLVIELLHDEEPPSSSREMPDIAGIKSFKLDKLERLHLEPPKKKGLAPGAKVEKGPAGLDTDRPLEITCEGPFYFDPVRQYAKFEDHVDVYQLNPEGQADQLNCELLTLYFSRSRKKLVTLDGKEMKSDPLNVDSSDLELREIEATGNPVIVRAFSHDAEARGGRLCYDVQKDRVVLEGGNEVFLRRGTSEIHARSVHYTSKGAGRLGEIFSQGPGWMRGEMPNRPGEQFFVSWNDRLQLEPYEDQHLAMLSGGVTLKYANMGTLNAERIDFWLFELPAGPGHEKLEVKPDRMLVQNHVEINSPEVFGNVNKLQIWFEEVAEGPSMQGGAVPARTSDSSKPGTSSGGSLTEQFRSPAGDKPIDRRYHVCGDLAQGRFLIRGEKAEPAELMLEGAVRLDEIPLVPSPEQPMHVTGDRVQVFDANDRAKTQISVLGRPALFRGRGMTLTGSNINVNAGTNSLWVNGSGEMKLPVDRDLKGNPLPRPDDLTVTWQKKMNFDGVKATFEEKVRAQARDQSLRTETLEVQFSERVEFRNVRSKSRPQPDLEQVVCRGDVIMEGRTFEEFATDAAIGVNGFAHGAGVPPGVGARAPQQESWEEFRANTLTINRRTGDLHAQGPGQLTTIRRQSGDPFDFRRGQNQPLAQPVRSGSSLAYLHVGFQQMMTGNVEQHTATFHDQVRCVYGEVDSWQERLDVYDPDALGDKGVLLTSDRLTVAEAPATTVSERSIELESVGNVVAENRTYFARANRVTYSEAKDWLILEGDGHSAAELSLQEFVGGPVKSFRARKINFWPGTKSVKIDDGQPFQMGGLTLP